MPAAADVERVTELLGRVPSGEFEVVVHDEAGEPVVIRNAPLLEDGTPMPTRYWLIGRAATLAVSRLEAAGGVRAAAAVLDPDAIAAAHAAYAAERDAALPPRHDGPRPTGGVGGTREGLKCLHAHYAWFLAGGDDPVGRWVHEQIGAGGHDGRVRPGASEHGGHDGRVRPGASEHDGHGAHGDPDRTVR